jgi:uncharacterized protein YlxP (DUF503 family)
MVGPVNIGILQLNLKVGDALTARDKRKILRSVKDRWHHHHNVSVAEVGDPDHPYYAMLGVAMVGTDRRLIEGALSRMVHSVETERRLELLDYQIEIL